MRQSRRWQRESREFFDSRNRRIGRARPDASTWQQESRGGTGNIGRGRDVALRARRVGERDAAQVQNDAERWQRETRAGVGNRRGRNGRAKANASVWQQESRGSTGNIARSIGAPTPASSAVDRPGQSGDRRAPPRSITAPRIPMDTPRLAPHFGPYRRLDNRSSLRRSGLPDSAPLSPSGPHSAQPLGRDRRQAATIAARAGTASY